MKESGPRYNFFVLLFASGFGAGYSPFASGTVATLIPGIPIFLLFSQMATGWYIAVTMFLIIISIYICEAGDRVLGEKDSSKIVIDEICGYLVTMMLIPVSVISVIAGFFLFRFFDIAKIQPAKWVEDKLPGGAGVALDDIIAGIYANIGLRIFLYIWDAVI